MFGSEIGHVQYGVVLVLEIHTAASMKTDVLSRSARGQTNTRGTFCQTNTCQSRDGGCGCLSHHTETRWGEVSGREQLPLDMASS